jgi:ABC-type bacteriocin/lantibiotic exporter with double-glycine peptidase domain
MEFDIRYEVELVPQLTGMSCWAAAAAMLVGFRDKVSINPSEIAKGIGYWQQYYNGLAPDDSTMFSYWGLIADSPKCYTIEGLRILLEDTGPLWVATQEGAPHARVITGMSGDGTYDGTYVWINDPWEIGMNQFRENNIGSSYVETFSEFMNKQYELAISEQDIPGSIYIAHL